MAPRAHAVLLVLLAVMAAGCGGTADGSAAASQEQQAGARPQMTSGSDMGGDPTISPAGQETGIPEGYELRLDRAGADPAGFRVTEENEGLYVQTGPAGILYRPADAVASGDYSVSATFTEVGAPVGHREAYGLFVGGSDLQGGNQAYTYFLVRGDGQYLIKRRSGSETSNVSDGWTESDAVKAAVEGEDLVNRLDVTVRGDAAHFSANGTEVASVPVARIDAHGVVGVRINHNLNVRIEDFALSK
jgi:hypothetical protein